MSTVLTAVGGPGGMPSAPGADVNEPPVTRTRPSSSSTAAAPVLGWASVPAGVHWLLVPADDPDASPFITISPTQSKANTPITATLRGFIALSFARRHGFQAFFKESRRSGGRCL